MNKFLNTFSYGYLGNDEVKAGQWWMLESSSFG